MVDDEIIRFGFFAANYLSVQAVVGSIVWAFPRLKKPRCREMSAGGYALYSVGPQLSFFSEGGLTHHMPPVSAHIEGESSLIAIESSSSSDRCG